MQKKHNRQNVYIDGQWDMKLQDIKDVYSFQRLISVLELLHWKQLFVCLLFKVQLLSVSLSPGDLIKVCP